MALFEVLIPNPGENISAILASAQPRGLFWSVNTTANNGDITAKLAAVTDNTLLGFNVRENTSTGLRTDAQILFEEGLEVPDKVGVPSSLAQPPLMLAIEDDSTHIYVSSTNPPTAAGDLVGFVAGKIHIAQSTEYAHYVVVSVEAGLEDATEERFILQKLDHVLKI